MKPMNFPERKAARQRSAALRRIPQITASLKCTMCDAPTLNQELAALTQVLALAYRDVRTKKARLARTAF